MKSAPPPPPAVCPACGADVPARARACPECGADENTGWNTDATACDGLDLPDAEFDDKEFQEKEWGTPRKPRNWTLIFWWFIAAILCALWIKDLLL